MGNDLAKHYPQNELRSIEYNDGSRVSKTYTDDEKQLHYPDVSTVYEAFLRGQRLSEDGPFLGRRSHTDGPYEWLIYSQISDMANAFGAGLINECRLIPSNSTNVGIFSQNRVEWVVCDQACVRYSMVLVPLYNTLGKEACQHIITQAEMSVVVCDNKEKVEQLLDMGDEIPNLQYIVLMDKESNEELAKRVEDRRWRLLTFEEVMESGRQSPRDLQPAQPEDTYTICYTSGTTGVPKGVVLTHLSFNISAYCIVKSFKTYGLIPSTNDVTLSYLPLAHIYERAATLVQMTEGARVAFFNGDITKLGKDLLDVQPTLFAAVPRILYRIYDKIYTAASQSCPKRKLLNWAVESKLDDLSYGILRDDTIWDKLVFSKVRDLFGGRIRHLTTAAALASPEIINFFRIALSCSMCNAYGQTETGLATVTALYDFKTNHVGMPGDCCRIKLIDVPELGYYADKGYGEICVKGPNTFKEYYKMPDKTAETIDDDGWVHTGDVGTWTVQGNLQIVDRCKQIFKLSQGEYIAPEKVEGVYQRCPHVAQVYVDGLGDKDYLVAIVVPDFEALAVTLGLTAVDEEALCNDPSVQQRILDEMVAAGRQNHLKGFEIVRRIHLHPTQFSVENGLLTPTLKSKRHELRKRFIDEVKAMYSFDEQSK